MVFRSISCAITVALVFGVATAPSFAQRTKRSAHATDALTEQDRAEIRALDARFVRGWLDDDEGAVLSVYAPDAILFPPGTTPLDGLVAIRAFWWPTDGSRTRIT